MLQLQAEGVLLGAGWGNTNEASVQAVMQLLAGNPQMYGAELSRQLAAGAGPYNIQAAQVPLFNGFIDLCKIRDLVDNTC